MTKTKTLGRGLNCLAILMAVGTASAFASQIQFTTTGTFDAGTAVTSLTAPGAFTLTFVTSDQPVPQAPTIGGSSFSLTLPATLMLGSTTADSGNITVDFFAGSSPDAGFEATLSQGTDMLHLSFGGPQLYSGSVPNVTILPISYTASGAFTDFYVNSSGNLNFGTAPMVAASTVPEPGTAANAIAGLALVAALILRRRSRAAITLARSHSN